MKIAQANDVKFKMQKENSKIQIKIKN